MMAVQEIDALDRQALEVACRAAVVQPDHRDLRVGLDQAAAPLAFRYARSGRHWYRLGGVVTADGDRVSQDLDDWLRRAFSQAEGDLERLGETLAARNLAATRIQGQLHYFVAPTGPDPADFVQLVVEETREVIDRPLVPEEGMPEDLEDLIDPREPTGGERRCVGEARYRLIWATDVAALAASLQAQGGQPWLRLLAHWRRSSARNVPFCHHYALKIRERRDGFGVRHVNVELRSLSQKALPRMEDPRTLEPLDLAFELRRFDRQAGHPFAWFLALVTGKGLSPDLPAVLQDHLGQGYRYLAERDIKILQDWLAQPYQL